MSLGKHKIELFYDVVSPWSYFAFETLLRYEKVWNLDVKLRPFFLGGVMQATGNKPPIMLPARGAYLLNDITRSGKYFGINIQQPSNFPASTLVAQRILVALQQSRPDKVIEFSRQCWKNYWTEDRDISTEDVLAQILDSLHLSPQTYFAAAKDPKVKEALKQVTEEAVQRGAFGAPTFFVTKANDPEKAQQMYFGSDRFHLIAMQLGERWDGPFPSSSKL